MSPDNVGGSVLGVTRQFHCGHLTFNCYVDSDFRYAHELFISIPQGREKYHGFKGLSPPKFLDPISFCSNK